MQQLNRSSHRINVMNHKLFLAFLLLFAVSCDSEWDPFTGEEGVRMNMNGKKYVMVTHRERMPYVYNNQNVYEQTLSLTVTMGWQGTRIGFRMWISDPDTLIQGNTYPAKARIGEDQDGVSLEGFAEILTLNPTSRKVEALFELSGGNSKESYIVKHGFFRLDEFRRESSSDSAEEYQQ